MCCIISGERVEDPKGRYVVHDGPNRFQTSMMDAPCHQLPWSCFWCMGQFLPCTMCVTQYSLRYKVLEGDMSKYTCCQSYTGKCCCFQPGEMGEKDCPELCLCLEALCCNGFAISASRRFVMDKYDLQSDPCDYRLIRINNCIQCAACICDLLAIFNNSFAECSRLLDCLADVFYHLTSGCMTAQVAVEMNYQSQQHNHTLQTGLVQ